MMRKHIISLNPDDFDKLPFKSWECITLFLGHREVNLIIKDEKDM